LKGSAIGKNEEAQARAAACGLLLEGAHDGQQDPEDLTVLIQ
jgi:hypothetical protein